MDETQVGQFQAKAQMFKVGHKSRFVAKNQKLKLTDPRFWCALYDAFDFLPVADMDFK